MEWKKLKCNHAEDLVTVTQNDGEYVVISDLHVPFHIEEAIEAIIEEHGDRDKYLVIAGDYVDCANISVYPKSALNTLLDEICLANNLLKELSTHFKQVFLLDGNHERRLYRYMESQASAVAMFNPQSVNYYVCHELRFHRDSIELVDRLPKVRYISSRFVQFGDVLITHPADSLTSTGGVAKRVIETAISHNLVDFKYAVIGHTHKVGVISHLGKLCYEIGCLTYDNSYIAKPNKMRPPQQHGFCTFEVKHGKAQRIDLTIFTLDEAFAN